MEDSDTKIQRDIGTPPGTLVHIGERIHDEARITLFSYNAERVEEHQLGSIEESLVFADLPDRVTWINVEGLHDISLFEAIATSYQIHPLFLEEVLDTEQRPQVEEDRDQVLIITKMMHFDQTSGELDLEHTALILGERLVITLQEGIRGDSFDKVRNRLRNNQGRVRKMQADFLLYALMDVIIDQYYSVLDVLGTRIEGLEERVLDDPGSDVLTEIHTLKQEMITVRRSCWPMRDVTHLLERSESRLIHQETRRYLNSLSDHIVHVIELNELYRESLRNTQDIYFSNVNNRMNSTINVLTIIMSIFIPLSFVTGIYGMNFKYMPEIESRWAYPAVWVVMIVIAVGMFIYFRNKHWV